MNPREPHQKSGMKNKRIVFRNAEVSGLTAQLPNWSLRRIISVE